MPARKKQTQTVDVMGPADIVPFQDLIKKNNLTIVLVWANYCGHCTTYKDQVWNQLKNLPDRRAGLSTVHYDQLENVGLGSAKIDGYPSILLVGNDKVPAEFSENGESTNALPNSRDIDLMKSIVQSEPEKVINSIPNMVRAPNIATTKGDVSNTGTTTTIDNNEGKSAEFDPETESLRKELSRSLAADISKEVDKERSVGRTPNAAVPNIRDDILDTQTRASGTGALQYEYTEGKDNAEPKRVGGNLYTSLLQAATDAAPAIALTAAGVAVARRRGKRKTRRTVKRKSRSRKLSRRRRT